MLENPRQLLEDCYDFISELEESREEEWESEGSALFDSVEENFEGPSQILQDETKQAVLQGKLCDAKKFLFQSNVVMH